MTFKVDRTSVTEGDVVEVQWDCTGADRVELKIDNGYKCSVMALAISGTKRFRLNRSKGRTSLTITAWVGEKHGSKTIKVRVQDVPTARAETVDDHGQRVNPASGWWQRLQKHWHQLPPDKRVANNALLILAASWLLSLISQGLFLVGMLGLIVYLFYVIYHRR